MHAVVADPRCCCLLLATAATTRGIRIRIGMHSGVHAANEVQELADGRGVARTTYSGACVRVFVCICVSLSDALSATLSMRLSVRV